MAALGVRNVIGGEGRLHTDRDLLCVELFERYGIEVVVLFSKP